MTLAIPADVLDAIDEVATMAGTSRETVIRVHLAQHFGKRLPANVVEQEKRDPRAPASGPSTPNTVPTLPNTGLLRLADIIGRRQGKGRTGTYVGPRLIPVSAATWYAGVKAGRFPKPVRQKYSSIAFWRVEDIRELMSAWAAESQQTVGWC